MKLLQIHDYDSDHNPAMPVVDIWISKQGGQTSINVQAIVDSGADVTMLPDTVLRQLGTKPLRRLWLRSVTGPPKRVNLHPIAIRLGNYPPQYIEVVSTPESDEAIVGRDILNQFVVTLNGPAHSVEIYD